jgi:hypothetical protein
MDSAFFQFDKEYPKIELSNLYDATEKYNLILANIFQWKQNHQLSMVLNHRPLFEVEFTQIWNEKTKKYNEIFSRIQLSNHLEQSVEEKIKIYIQESLSELFKPLNAYQVITKENAEESLKLYQYLFRKSMILCAKLSKKITDPALAKKFDKLFMEELDGSTSSFLMKRNRFMQSIKK